MESYGISRTGYGKSVDEDSFGGCFSADGKVCFTVVADGMGGHAAGDIASKLTVEGFIAAAKTFVYESPGKLRDFMRDAVVAVSKAVEADAEENRERKNMGSTAVILAFVPEYKIAAVCHAGDSRAYRYRNGELEPLTRDHSIARLMLDKGYTREEIRKYLSKNAITKAVGFLSGIGPGGLPDTESFECLEGDMFLLCSDGLSAGADDDEICAVLRETDKDSCEKICEALLRLALGSGSGDDITVALLRI